MGKGREAEYLLHTGRSLADDKAQASLNAPSVFLSTLTDFEAWQRALAERIHAENLPPLELRLKSAKRRPPGR